MKVKVITSNTRGFLKNLFDSPLSKVEFVYNKKNIYEVSGISRKILATIIKFKIFDYLGFFRIIKTGNIQEEICFSYNRFLNTEKPYVIVLENPSALVNYCWDRPKYFLAKKKLKQCFEDENLKAIVCMSKTCEKFFPNLYECPSTLNVVQNYPLIRDDFTYGIQNIHYFVHSKEIECLFISSNFNLKGGCDIIEVFERLKEFPIKLTIITQISTIHKTQMERINKLESISLIEFNLSKQELDEYYKKSVILLNPTRADSFSLVTLEAIKYGCVVLATDIYAIKEMVKNGINGYLCSPMYPVWDEDGTFNKYIRRHQKQTIYSGNIDTNMVEWMYTKLIYLNNNRDILEKMCCASLNLARYGEFSEKEIMNKWNMLLAQCEDNK